MLNRRKEILQVSPFVGYNFKEEATCLSSAPGLGIFMPTRDDPLQSLQSLTKMRRNLYCLENPETFKDINNGMIRFNHNNTFILKSPNAKKLQKRVRGFRLEDLP